MKDCTGTGEQLVSEATEFSSLRGDPGESEGMLSAFRGAATLHPAAEAAEMGAVLS